MVTRSANLQVLFSMQSITCTLFPNNLLFTVTLPCSCKSCVYNYMACLKPVNILQLFKPPLYTVTAQSTSNKQDH